MQEKKKEEEAWASHLQPKWQPSDRSITHPPPNSRSLSRSCVATLQDKPLGIFKTLPPTLKSTTFSTSEWSKLPLDSVQLLYSHWLWHFLTQAPQSTCCHRSHERGGKQRKRCTAQGETGSGHELGGLPLVVLSNRSIEVLAYRWLALYSQPGGQPKTRRHSIPGRFEKGSTQKAGSTRAASRA